MNIIGILQARMSSTRLPGKVVKPILDVPMILRQLHRLSKSTKLDEIVVATSTHQSDDNLAELLTEHGYKVVRGELDDVLARFLKVIEIFHPDAVVRLTADCPLTSPRVMDEVIEAYIESGCDYASNTLVPTFPDGLDVEVVSASALSILSTISEDPLEREHVTLGIYRRPELFDLLSIERTPSLSSLRWTVDTLDDLNFVRWVYEELWPLRQDFDLDDVLRLLKRNPGMNRTFRDGSRNEALTGHDVGAMKLTSGAEEH